MKKELSLLLIIFSCLKLTSQSITSFDSLKELYYQERQNRNYKKVQYYGNQFLKKAKESKDTSNIAEGYILLAHGSYGNESIVYIDSSITVTKNHPNFIQPAKSYIHKATMHSVLGEYKRAFNAINFANKYAISNENSNQQSEIKYLLSRLKTKIGDYEGSIEIIKNLLLQYEEYKEECKGCIRGHIIILWEYAYNLNFLGNFDKAENIYKKAFPMSLKTKDSIAYKKLLLASAITKYHKKEYNSSIDSLNKISEINKLRKINKNYYNTTNILLEYLYRGKIYLQKNQNELAVFNLKKVDSIAFGSNYFHPLIRENYELLIDYYKSKNDVDNQLLHIDKLLKTDSVLDNNFAFITKNINSKYTTPNLLLKKEQIITSLKKNDTIKKITLFTLVLFSAVLIVALYINNKKKKLYKKHAEELGNSKENKNNGYLIDDKTTQRLLNELEFIEQSELFLNHDFNLSLLAKKLDTNTAYISKIINKHKGKTFKQYLIEYRIKALIQKLDNTPILRKHSIDALAKSIGYNNASSFTRIFKNYLGESPSAFLKKRYPMDSNN